MFYVCALSMYRNYIQIEHLRDQQSKFQQILNYKNSWLFCFCKRISLEKTTNQVEVWRIWKHIQSTHKQSIKKIRQLGKFSGLNNRENTWYTNIYCTGNTELYVSTPEYWASLIYVFIMTTEKKRDGNNIIEDQWKCQSIKW